MKKPRVLMADDHSLILAGLRKLIEGECEVVGTVEDGRALVEAAQKLRPDLILLDVSMPLLNGLEAARQLHTLVPECKVRPMPPKRSRPGPPDISSSAPRLQNSAWRSSRSSKANTISRRRSRRMCWTRSSSHPPGSEASL
jgi:CheY-like chemotaxis protein